MIIGEAAMTNNLIRASAVDFNALTIIYKREGHHGKPRPDSAYARFAGNPLAPVHRHQQNRGEDQCHPADCL